MYVLCQNILFMISVYFWAKFEVFWQELSIKISILVYVVLRLCWHMQARRLFLEVWVNVTNRYSVRGASVYVQGRGVVVGDGSSGQCGWRGKANCVAAVWETCNRDRTPVL